MFTRSSACLWIEGYLPHGSTIQKRCVIWSRVLTVLAWKRFDTRVMGEFVSTCSWMGHCVRLCVTPAHPSTWSQYCRYPWWQTGNKLCDRISLTIRTEPSASWPVQAISAVDGRPSSEGVFVVIRRPSCRPRKTYRNMVVSPPTNQMKLG